jgi:mRNA-degrading endonuclease RelE of RelBE toxin-antitoxin system
MHIFIYRPVQITYNIGLSEVKNKIEWTNKALRQLHKLPPTAVRGILDRVKALSTWPKVSGVVKLVNRPEYRLQTGRYRVIFNVYPGEKLIVLQIEEVLKRNERTYSH